ncbi:MAG: prolyl oligopeptidase family serine peptidase, partial [Actinomycetota bacterium]
MSGGATRAAWEARFRVPVATLPHWSDAAPDRLVYVSDASGILQAYAWDRASGTHRRATSEPVGVVLAEVSHDGSEVIWFSDATGDESGRWVAAPFGGGEPRDLLPGAPHGWPEGISLGGTATAAVLADAAGFAVVVRDAAGTRVLRTDDEAISIGPGDVGIEGTVRGGVSPDGGALCIATARGGDSLHRVLRVLDLADGRELGVLSDGADSALSPVAWSPDPSDRRLLIAHERDDLTRPATWDPRTGERIDLRLDLPGEAHPLDWFADARSILVLHRHRGRDALLRVDLATGGIIELAPARGEIAGARVRPDGSVWRRELHSTRASRVLDDRDAAVLAPPDEGHGPGDPTGRPYRSWTFANPVGETVHGFVVAPEGPGPFPLYLKVHGGPTWLYGDTFHPDAQAIVDLGFAVAIVNYRGSTGYGRRWRDRIIGDVGFPELEDVTAGADDLIARGIADPDRVVLAGWSWGGYLGLLGAGTRPDRWKAVVAGVPVGDYVASYDDSSPALQAYDRA